MGNETDRPKEEQPISPQLRVNIEEKKNRLSQFRATLTLDKLKEEAFKRFEAAYGEKIPKPAKKKLEEKFNAKNFKKDLDNTFTTTEAKINEIEKSKDSKKTVQDAEDFLSELVSPSAFIDTKTADGKEKNIKLFIKIYEEILKKAKERKLQAANLAQEISGERKEPTPPVTPPEPPKKESPVEATAPKLPAKTTPPEKSAPKEAPKPQTLADILKKEGVEITPRDIEKALKLYALGKHEEGQEENKTKNALDILARLKKEGKLKGIKITYIGSTDGSKYIFIKRTDWHQTKKSAFEKLLAFNAQNKLTSNPPLEPDKIDLIKEYITAVDQHKEKKFIKQHKADFLSGQRLFDYATAVQRAEDLKKRIDEKILDANDADIALHLKLGSVENKDEDRNSHLEMEGTAKTKKEPEKEDKPTKDKAKETPNTHPTSYEFDKDKGTFTVQFTDKTTKSTTLLDFPPEITLTKVSISQQNQPRDGKECIEIKLDEGNVAWLVYQPELNAFTIVGKVVFVAKEKNIAYLINKTADGNFFMLSYIKETQAIKKQVEKTETQSPTPTKERGKEGDIVRTKTENWIYVKNTWRIIKEEKEFKQITENPQYYLYGNTLKVVFPNGDNIVTHIINLPENFEITPLVYYSIQYKGKKYEGQGSFKIYPKNKIENGADIWYSVEKKKFIPRNGEALAVSGYKLIHLDNGDFEVRKIEAKKEKKSPTSPDTAQNPAKKSPARRKTPKPKKTPAKKKKKKKKNSLPHTQEKREYSWSQI